MVVTAITLDVAVRGRINRVCAKLSCIAVYLCVVLVLFFEFVACGLLTRKTILQNSVTSKDHRRSNKRPKLQKAKPEEHKPMQFATTHSTF